MRARDPDAAGFAVNEGVRVAWESFGDGAAPVLFVPTWNVVHSRISKMQVASLARRHRVVTYDPRGNGRSDCPATGYRYEDHYRDALAVMDATGLARASVVVASSGVNSAVLLAARHPERVARLVIVGASPALDDREPDPDFWRERERYMGWEKWNAPYWLAHYEDFLWFFMEEAFTEPHSTKPIEDAVGWGLETTPQLLVQGMRERREERFNLRPLLAQVQCPTLVVHGDGDHLSPLDVGAAMADAIPDARLVVFEGSGHRPDIRDPVKFNLLLFDFLSGDEPPHDRRITRAAHRPRPRALYISSPIGLGHVARDLAIANELRRLRPDLEVVWLAQHPITTVLEAAGETIHPASRHLASESAHVESEMGEHELRVFEAWRRMDEVLLANFMLFHEVVRDDRYDLWLGDEAWELDHYLHENPELKSAPYVFMTDFVGWLPMDDGEGSREALLAADYNAENLEQVERYPYVRDAALFVGTAADVVPRSFGPGLPYIPDWVERQFDFPGYILPFEPADYADTERIRRELDLDPKRPLIVATVGGSGVGVYLLRRIAEAFRLLRRNVPDARLLVVAGPRIDPAAIEPVEGMDVVGYVRDLFRTLAACDLAVVQGGLTTTMELVATRRPFIYVPLRGHFEQNLHVVHRLRRYGAPPPTSYEDATPQRLAEEMFERLGRDVTYAPVESGGAARAAELIAPLIEERKGTTASSARVMVG
ncbi:MAG: alpha/beta fold hydrolase [Chloroflexota bacterium]